MQKGLRMIISEKQIMQLIEFTHGYLDLISLVVQMGMSMNSPNEIRQEITNLLNQIIRQQSEEPKVIE